MEVKLLHWAKAAAMRKANAEAEEASLQPPKITLKAQRLRRQSRDWERMAVGEGDIRAIKLAQLTAESEECACATLHMSPIHAPTRPCTSLSFFHSFDLLLPLIPSPFPFTLSLIQEGVRRVHLPA